MGPDNINLSGKFNSHKDDTDLMEKKIIDKKFLLLSSVNIIPALILGGGLTKDSAALVGFLAVLMMNHITLVKLVQTLAMSMSSNNDAGSPLARILFLLGLKTLVLGAAIGIIYFYNKDLLPKVMLMMIFQLIIQVLSIKNNHQI